MINILIVEDEEPINNLISMNLKSEGYNPISAFDGEQAVNIIESNHFDLVLLDIMLPKIDGYELLEYIKPQGIPVIFITAKGMTCDRIKGLKLGADDYIVKPFQVGELMARIEALMRRLDKVSETLCFYDVEINLKSRQVMQNGNLITLTVKEYELLIELINNKNIALHRSKLYEKIWEEEYIGETRTLDAHIQRLRKKLNWDEKIKTVFRIGYRLES